MPGSYISKKLNLICGKRCEAVNAACGRSIAVVEDGCHQITSLYVERWLKLRRAATHVITFHSRLTRHPFRRDCLADWSVVIRHGRSAAPLLRSTAGHQTFNSATYFDPPSVRYSVKDLRLAFCFVSNDPPS